MNYRGVAYIVGQVLKIESALFLFPLGIGLLYRESAAFSILISCILCLAIGLLLTVRKPQNIHFYTREGYVSVSLSWIALSIMGALPFLFSGIITHPVDAVFETVSGFTTTGASILSDVESLPRCILFWRSFTHWIGGMGVLVFLLSLFKITGGSQMNLMKAESPGPSVDRLVPTVRSTAKILYQIYFALTVAEVVLLLLAGMPVFDALTTTFGTAGTGGFGIKNNSIGGYSHAIQIVVTIFMILFGVNFNCFYLVLIHKWKQALKSEELRWYLLIIAGAIAVIAINIKGFYPTPGETLRHAAFQVASIITTTGYATVDFNCWPELSRTILIMLMFIGACAGSTGGGIKVSRILILLKSMQKEVRQYLHPRQVRRIQLSGKPVEHEVIRNVNVFMTIYVLIYAVSMLILAFDGKDLITNFTAVAATINNIGPGLELVGPTANFALFSVPAKLVLIFDMLAGRLEIFPLFLLLFHGTWKRF